MEICYFYKNRSDLKKCIDFNGKVSQFQSEWYFEREERIQPQTSLKTWLSGMWKMDIQVSAPIQASRDLAFNIVSNFPGPNIRILVILAWGFCFGGF